MRDGSDSVGFIFLDIAHKIIFFSIQSLINIFSSYLKESTLDVSFIISEFFAEGHSYGILEDIVIRIPMLHGQLHSLNFQDGGFIPKN